MMTFPEQLKPSQALALHYANTLKCPLATEIFQGKRDVSSKDEAINLTRFFWEMVDIEVEDQENDREIASVTGLEHWMEKLMNLMSGYCKKQGYFQQWSEESNRINGSD